MAVSPSSTSSSDRSRAGWPLAGALALLLFFAADRLVFDWVPLWEAVVQRIPGRSMHASGAAKARLALSRARRLDPDLPTSFVLGSSRTIYGYTPERVPPADRPPGEVFELSHPQLFGFEMLAYADELVEIGPTSVVFLVSEFDTHRPLELMTGSACASLSAVAFLARALPRDVREAQQQMLIRLSLESLVQSYRYRSILGAAGLDRVRTFELDPRYGRFSRGHVVEIIGPGQKSRPSPEQVQSIVDALGGGNSKRGRRAYFKSHHLLTPITRGQHAELQMSLLREAVSRLRSAEVEVIVVEAPVSPLAPGLYDTTIRQDYLDFVASLERDHGIHFVALDPDRPYLRSEFGDLVHLGASGAERLTRTVNQAIRAAGEGVAARLDE